MSLVTFYIVFIIALQSVAINSYKVTKAGGSLQIHEFSLCRRVTNNRTLDLFIPTKTSTEWAAFRSKVPTNVTAQYCFYNQNCAAAGSGGSCADTYICPHGTVRRLKMACSTQENIDHTATINANTWNTAEVIGALGSHGAACKIGTTSYDTGTTSLTGHPAIGAASFNYSCNGNCSIYIQVECGD